MPNYLDVEPDQLRSIAKQHDLLAADIRKWGEIPHDWLADFEHTYGMIADPVRAALVDYYNRRHESAERLAAKHERTRDELLATAEALENADNSGGQQIGHAGGFDGAPRGGPTPGAADDRPTPGYPDPEAPSSNGSQPPSTTTSTAPETPSGTGTPDRAQAPPAAQVAPAASAPQPDGAGPSGVAAPTGGMPFVSGVPEPDVDDGSHAGGVERSVDPPLTSGATDTAVDSNGGAGTGEGMLAPVMAAPSQGPVLSSGGGASVRPPAPLPAGPFAAALHTAENRRALPSFVVGERTEDDLALARTLLAGVLAAVRDSAPNLEWGVGVGRTSAGPLVLLTSTEGRGWLPPGLFLPAEVVIPWRWANILGTAGRETVAALEGTADPARMLAEFFLSVSRRRAGRISALVSSAAISDNLRMALGDDVAIEDRVSAAESAVDLTSPGVGLVDRLALAGSDESLWQASAVPEVEIRAKCIELARAADARVRTAISGIGAESSFHRAPILDALQAGLPIPANWWDEIRVGDAMTAAALAARRIDLSHMPVGGVSPNVTGTEIQRGMVFERRADELLLLLAAGEPDRQTLRDALYAYGEIAEHPLLPAAARVVATETPRRSTAVSDAVFAPGVEVGSSGVDAVGHGGTPPSVAGMSGGPAGFESSGEQRRAL